MKNCIFICYKKDHHICIANSFLVTKFFFLVLEKIWLFTPETVDNTGKNLKIITHKKEK